jgi:hypothetical protein
MGALPVAFLMSALALSSSFRQQHLLDALTRGLLTGGPQWDAQADPVTETEVMQAIGLYERLNGERLDPVWVRATLRPPSGKPTTFVLAADPEAKSQGTPQRATLRQRWKAWRRTRRMRRQRQQLAVLARMGAQREDRIQYLRQRADFWNNSLLIYSGVVNVFNLGTALLKHVVPQGLDLCVSAAEILSGPFLLIWSLRVILQATPYQMVSLAPADRILWGHSPRAVAYLAQRDASHPLLVVEALHLDDLMAEDGLMEPLPLASPQTVTDRTPS